MARSISRRREAWSRAGRHICHSRCGLTCWSFRAGRWRDDVEVTGNIVVKLCVRPRRRSIRTSPPNCSTYIPPSPDYPEGYHMCLTDSIFAAAIATLRTRGADAARPDLPVQIVLPPTSNLFKAGHRIRLDISSSNFPRFDLNPNTGEPIGRHTHRGCA